MIHCGGGGGLCRVTLMKLIVFVEFCLIPNCFLPTIEVGGQVCSQNNFLPQERQHTRKGNRAVDAFLEFVKTSPGCIGLSTRSLAVTPWGLGQKCPLFSTQHALQIKVEHYYQALNTGLIHLYPSYFSQDVFLRK